MDDPDNSTPTCLSDEDHVHAITDPELHFLGCIKIAERDTFFSNSNPLWEDEIAHRAKQAEKRGLNQEEAHIKARSDVTKDSNKWGKSCKNRIDRIDYLRRALSQDPNERHLVQNITKSSNTWRKGLLAQQAATRQASLR